MHVQQPDLLYDLLTNYRLWTVSIIVIIGHFQHEDWQRETAEYAVSCAAQLTNTSLLLSNQ